MLKAVFQLLCSCSSFYSNVVTVCFMGLFARKSDVTVTGENTSLWCNSVMTGQKVETDNRLDVLMSCLNALVLSRSTLQNNEMRPPIRMQFR